LRFLDRAVYTTITIMSVLIVYDGWQNLKFWAAVGVIIGPVLAMFISHVFSAFLARQAERVRAPRSSTEAGWPAVTDGLRCSAARPLGR